VYCACKLYRSLLRLTTHSICQNGNRFRIRVSLRHERICCLLKITHCFHQPFTSVSRSPVARTLPQIRLSGLQQLQSLEAEADTSFQADSPKCTIIAQRVCIEGSSKANTNVLCASASWAGGLGLQSSGLCPLGLSSRAPCCAVQHIALRNRKTALFSLYSLHIHDLPVTTKSEGVGLGVRPISFQDFQPM